MRCIWENCTLPAADAFLRAEDADPSIVSSSYSNIYVFIYFQIWHEFHSNETMGKWFLVKEIFNSLAKNDVD